MNTQLTVLYDADCGVCSHTARVLRRADSRRRLRFVALQTAALPGMPQRKELMASLHVRDDSGRWSEGGAAWVEISRRVPLLRPLSFYAKLPLAMPVLDVLFQTIADNRHTISRVLGLRVCQVPEMRS
jgi:predicted DCC family thiol-disulfide oxidoreductase YuxK